MEKSADGSLTSKADYYISSPFTENVRISTSSQWGVIDNYTINATAVGGQDIPFGFEYLAWDNVCFSGDSGSNYKLEYYIAVYQYNTNTKLFESGWTPNNTPVRVVSRDWSPTGLSKRQRVEIYVRRNEFNDQGERRWLVPSDMRPCGFAENFIGYTKVTQETIPSEWLETTTIAVENPLSTATTVIDESQYSLDVDTDPFLTLPVAISNGIHLLLTPIGIILDLKYVTFFVCFCLVCFIVAWLLH